MTNGSTKKYVLDTNILIKNTNESISRSVEINDKYKMIDEVSKKSEADPIIIAFCEQDKKNNILLTREGYKKIGNDLYKIPDVCVKLGIEFKRNMKDFYKHIDYKEKENTN